MEEETMRASFYQYETVGYIINRALLLVGSWLYVLCCFVAKIMNYVDALLLGMSMSEVISLT